MTDTTQHTDGAITATASLNVEGAPNEPTIKFEDFTKVIPQELKSLYEKNGVKDFETLKKDYEGFNILKGKKGLVKPDDNAPEELKQAYQKQLFQELGVPENGEYEYELPEIVKEEWVDQTFLDELAAVAADNGINKKAFQEVINKVYSKYGEMVNEAMKGLSQDGLKKEWGDSFAENAQLANNMFKKYIGAEGSEAFMKKFGQDPDAIKFFYNMAKANKEKMGSLDDGNVIDKPNLKEQAANKTREYLEAQQAGDYLKAEQLQKEAFDLLQRAS
jgi:hypothetical protein